MVIDTLQLDIIVNNKGTTARINNTTKSLQNLYNVIQQINGAGGVNGAVNGGGGSGGGTSSRSSGASRASNTARNLNKALNIGSLVGKLYFVRNVTKQLGQTLAQVVQYGIDYEETLNLWQVAMRGNISQARIFVSEMNKAYGVSEATLMNYQAIFRNMLSALGNISEASSYVISESLTQMALDFASLYNTSVESAMTKFQAVLSGQVRPIRTAGYDITEQTLFQLYQQLGGTKTVRQLNQTEKQLLRILAVFKQMETVGATGDLRKTIESSANQLRIMKEQAKDFATWVGISLNLLLQESGILVTINSYLIVFKELAKTLAYELGYVEKDFGIEWGDNIAEAGEEVDKLKGKLLGFDKFQVLSSAGTEDVGIEQTLLDALGAYDSILDGFENPAIAKAEKLLNKMGLHLVDVKNEQGEVIDQVYKFEDGEKSILDYIKDIATALLGVSTVVGVISGIATGNWVSLIASLLMASEALIFVGEGNQLNEFGGSLKDLLATALVLLTQIGEMALPIVVFLADLIVALMPILTDLLEPIAGWFEPIGAFLDDFLLVSKNIVYMLLPLVGIFADVLAIGTPLLNIARILLSFVLSIINAVSVFLGVIVTGVDFIAESISKVIYSIGSFVDYFLQLDLLSWPDKMRELWSSGNWKSFGAIEAIEDILKNSTIAGKYGIPLFADGGVATKGSLFYAGEAGPELITQTSGGGSTIMNMKQLEDAVARGFIRGVAATDNGYEDSDTTEVYVDGQRLFNIMRGTAKRNGYDFVRI